MALFARMSSPTTTTTKNIFQFQSCMGFLWPSMNKSTNIDVIDSFTTDLVLKKTQKWESLKESFKKSQNYGSTTSTSFSKTIAGVVLNETPDLGLDIRTLSQPQIDNLLLATLEIKNKLDFLYLIKECVMWRKLPSDEALVESLKYLSSLGETDLITRIDEICRTESCNVTKKYVGLAPFKGMSQWRNGSADVAIKILFDGYKNNQTDAGRRMLRSAFKTISEETLSLKSEAVLVSLLKNAVQIYEDFKDIFVVACVWRNCFGSDWFSDQKSAENLFDKYPELQELVYKRTPTLCAAFLRQHKVDAVHRLIELFLKNNNQKSCGICLGLLFDYQYLRNDLRACAEIVKSSTELDIPLTDDQNEKFLSLFLNKPTIKPKRTRPHNFEYKF